jgi:mutator protein MutT
MTAAAVKPVDVAVGILVKPNGDVLLGQRPAGKPYDGYWEFPGGKVDPGETILQALKREFVEELGLTIHSAEEWCGVEYVYPHAHVRLHFYISRTSLRPRRRQVDTVLELQRSTEQKLDGTCSQASIRLFLGLAQVGQAEQRSWQ